MFPAKLFSMRKSAAILVVLGLLFVQAASANTTPKFVYVANSGDQYPGDQVETFQISATATCTSFPCASAISISGSITMDMGVGRAYGTLYLTDGLDLKSVVTVGTSIPATPTTPMTSPFYFSTSGNSSEQSQYTNVTLALPFTFFPGGYSGGPLCTSLSTAGCTAVSGFSIQAANMSQSLLAATGGATVTGTITSGSLTVVSNTQGSNTISGYAINATTGALTPLPGSPFTVGLNPYAVALDPSSKFLYVANRVSDSISAFTVNAATGALTPIAGSPFTAGYGPDSLAVDPSGAFIYAANQLSNNIWAYSIDSETGALTPINGSPFAAGISPTSLTMDPLGRFLYVYCDDTQAPYFETLGFTINNATGALTPIPESDIATNYAPGPLGGVEDPTGKYLFAIGYFIPDWGIGPLDINSSTGGLTALPYGNGLDVPGAVAVHPSGNFLYETAQQSGYITAYAIDPSTGSMTILPGSPYGDDCAHVTTCYPMGPYSGPYSTGSEPLSMSIDPSGQFAYVGNMYSNNISAYSINTTTGALSPVPGSPFAAGAGPVSVAIASQYFVPFSNFTVSAAINYARATAFCVQGTFTLGAATNGIYPLSENVTVQFGSYSVTVPGGSLKAKGSTAYLYEGQINGVTVEVEFIHVTGNEYSFTVVGQGNILAGATNPVAVSLAIGDDQGSTTVTAQIVE